MAVQIQDSGLAKITAVFAVSSLWFQWGTGTGAAKTANTVTTTGTSEARTAASLSQTTTTVANDTLRATATLTAAETVSITEIGLFDSAGSGSPPTGGNMDLYGDFTAIALTSGDSIAVTFDTVFADPSGSFAWPDATNTGYSGTLTAYSGENPVTTANTTIENKHITGGIDIETTGVTIRNCLIDGGSGFWIINTHDNDVTIENCTIVGVGQSDGGNGTMGIYGNGTFSQNDISQVMHGIHTQSGVSTITSNYIHDLNSLTSAGPHYNAIYISEGNTAGPMLIQDNTCVGKPTSAIGILTDFGNIDDVTINHNLCLADASNPPNYTIYCGASGGFTITNVSITNNVIQDGAFGYFDVFGCTPTISGNADYMTGDPVS